MSEASTKADSQTAEFSLIDDLSAIAPEAWQALAGEQPMLSHADRKSVV